MVGHRGYYCNCSPNGVVICRDDIGRSNKSGNKSDGNRTECLNIQSKIEEIKKAVSTSVIQPFLII